MQSQIIKANPHFDCQDVTVGQEICVKDLKITFVSAKHPINTLGIMVQAEDKTFYYTGDTSFTEDVLLNGKQSNLVLCDAPFTKDAWAEAKPHMAVWQCAEIAKQIKGKVVLTHHIPFIDKNKVIEELMGSPNVILADEYEQYDF